MVVNSMIYQAKYMHRRHEQPEYWRTICADSLNEAIKIADRYARNGFICVGLKQTDCA